jgi:uncharacterized RDD family membrane protein YckC
LAVPGAPGLEYSGALPRFVAYFVDGIILGIIGAAIQAVIYAVGLPVAGLSVADAYGNAPAYLAIGVVAVVVVTAVEAAYFILLWASDGRATLGMRLLKIQVGDATDGRTISKETAFRRWLALGAWLPALVVVPALAGLANLVFLVWSLVLLVSTVSSPTKQGIHDRFANTAMVQPAGGSSNGMVMGCVVILAVVVGLVVLSFIALIFLGGQVSSILSEVGGSI